MSAGPVLYDVPGPRARRQAWILSVVAVVALLALAVVVVRRLDAQGQFSYEKWGPIIDPSNDVFTPAWRLIGEGLGNTLVAAVLAILFSLVVGTVAGTTRMLLGRRGRIPLVGVMEVLRGLPVVVLILISYRMLPELGVNVAPLPGEDGLWYLVIALTAYNSVIIAEILRAGVAALPRGQSEAAAAIGLGRVQTMRLVLLPQAFRLMMPALISQLVVILKDTSLAAFIGAYIELLRQTNRMIADLGNPIQLYTVTGAIYIAINLGLSYLATRAERRISRGARAPRPTDAPSGPAEPVAAAGPALR